MKKLFILIFAVALVLSCSDDEPEVVSGGPTPTIDTITYDVGAITSTSIVIDFTSNTFTSSGGELIREIWYKKTC